MAQIQKIIRENQLLKNKVSRLEEVAGIKPYISDTTIRGGYKIVNSIQERDEINCCNRKLGMVVSVKITDTEYKNYRLIGNNICSNNWQEVTTDGDVPGPPGPPGPVGEVSVINFKINDNMHLIMNLETNTNLNFELNANGHLILTS